MYIFETPKRTYEYRQPLFQSQVFQISEPEWNPLSPDPKHGITGTEKSKRRGGKCSRVQHPHDIGVWLLPRDVKLHLFLEGLTGIQPDVVLLHLQAVAGVQQDLAVLIEADAHPGACRLGKGGFMGGI